MSLGDGFPFLLVVDLEATCDDAGAVPKHEMETIEIGAVVVECASLEPVDRGANTTRTSSRRTRLTTAPSSGSAVT